MTRLRNIWLDLKRGPVILDETTVIPGTIMRLSVTRRSQ